MIRYPEQGWRELYDLTSDPGENQNLVQQEPGVAAPATTSRSKRWNASTSSQAPPDTGNENERILEKLRSLGYIQ